MGKQNARWNEASDVIPMFPTLAWKIELEAELREAIGEEERISISFNVMFSSFTENLAKPLW